MLDDLADRVVAVGVIPYPPGIPIVMPGESVGAGGRSLGQLPAHAAGIRPPFPGFAKEVEGTEERDGIYHIYCVTAAAMKQTTTARQEESQTRRASRPHRVPHGKAVGV